MRKNSDQRDLQDSQYTLSTEQFAALNQVKANTVRKRLGETGSYWGVAPMRLRNSRLAWPNEQVSK